MRRVLKKTSGNCLKMRGELAQAVLPGGAVDDEGGRREARTCGWLGFVAGEVGGGVFFLGADLLLGLDLEVAVERFAVAAVGGEPEAARDGGAVVGEGQRDGGEGAVAMVAVGVVLGGRAEADLDIGDAAAALV